MKKLIEDMRNASAQAVGGTAFLDRHTLELAANQIEQLQSRLESLEKDAARFKKLAAHMTFALDGEFVTMDFSCPVDATKTHDIHEDWIEPNFTDSVRNTVDAAMQANKGE